MKRIGLFALNLVVTLVGGWVLAHIVVGLSAEMPAPLEDALRVLLRIMGHEEFANEEDLPALGMMAVLIASIVVVGGLVWVAKRIVRGSIASGREILTDMFRPLATHCCRSESRYPASALEPTAVIETII